MVVFSNQDTYDSFPLKDLSKYKNIRKFISFPNPSNQQQARTESINKKINSSKRIHFSDSIKIAEITNYFYYNGHLGISDGLLNKFHLFNFNNPDDKISYKWYNFNFFPDYQFTKCNCFDTLMHKSSKLKSGNFYHPMFKKQIFHSFLNDTGFFLMMKYPYFSSEIKNDTTFLTIESKAFIYGRGYHAKKGNFISIKEDGVINKIKESFVQDFYFPFLIDNKDIYTKVYNEQNFYDNRFIAKYIILDSCISSFHSLINFEYKVIDKLNKQASIMRNNSNFYYFINDFIFWDYKNFNLYHIPLKKIKCNKKANLLSGIL